jgi:hypothetical protein
LALRDRAYYLNETKITDAYQTYIADVASILNYGKPVDPKDVNDIFRFEQKLATVMQVLIRSGCVSP